MQHRREYLSRAWKEMRANQGWFRPIALLALCRLVPVFGDIVTYGFFYDWARESAWKVDRPMKTTLGDMGKTMKLGVIVWGIMVIWATVISVAFGVFEVIPIIGIVVSVVALPATILVFFLSSVASMRAAIYDSFEPVLQIKQAWNMLFHDFGGALRVFCIQLFNVGIGLVLGFIIAAIVFALGAGVTGFYGLDYLLYSDPSYLTADMSALIGLLTLMPLIILVCLVVGYAVNLLATIINGLQIKALGYWTADFEVPRWGGQQDPLPFERDAAAGMPVYPVPPTQSVQTPQPGQVSQPGQVVQPSQPAQPAQAAPFPTSVTSAVPVADPAPQPEQVAIAVETPAVEVSEIASEIADLGGVAPNEAPAEGGVLADDGAEE